MVLFNLVIVIVLNPLWPIQYSSSSCFLLVSVIMYLFPSCYKFRSGFIDHTELVTVFISDVTVTSFVYLDYLQFMWSLTWLSLSFLVAFVNMFHLFSISLSLFFFVVGKSFKATAQGVELQVNSSGPHELSRVWGLWRPWWWEFASQSREERMLKTEKILDICGEFLWVCSWVLIKEVIKVVSKKHWKATGRIISGAPNGQK